MSLYGAGWTPNFPLYLNESGVFRDDTIAVTDGRGNIFTEYGEVITYSNFDEFKAHMFTDQLKLEGGKEAKALLVLYDGDIRKLDIWEEMYERMDEANTEYEIRKGAVTVIVNLKTQKTNYVKFHRGGDKSISGVRIANLITQEAWALQKKPPLFVFENLRDCFDYFKVGSHASQLSLGFTILKQTWFIQYGKEWRMHRLRGLPNGIAYAMEKLPIPPYVFTPGRGQWFTEGDSLDIKAAYPWALGEQRGVPDGPPFHLNSHGKGYTVENLISRGFLHWQGMHKCIITEPLPAPCFAVEVKNGKSIKSNLVRDGGQRWHHPTSPGEYEAFMTEDMAQACETWGVHVELLWGWGWKKTRNDLRMFVDTMERFRNEAPTPYIEARAKDIVNKVIGGLGMDSTTRYEVKYQIK